MSEPRLSQPTHYAIGIKEHIPSSWSRWFEGLTITNLDDGGSILSGPVADQSALHGLLAKVRDLNLTLISVTRIEPPQSETEPGGKG
ncbi:MAG TPA: hypothetical protein VE136_09855 [Anaerolineales bacterium]|nr:hypothetical protein [Anaerolineales bacterium]